MSNFIDVVLPSDQTEGTRSQVLAWLKTVGDPVSENEPLLEIETDKVTVEIPSPCAGVLVEILKDASAEIESGAVLARIDRTAGVRAGSTVTLSPTPEAATAEAQSAARPRKSQGTATALSPAVQRLLAEHQLQAEEIAGSGPAGKITVGDVLRHAGGRPPRPPVAPAAPIATAHTEVAQGRLVPHSRMRIQIAERMVASLHTAPHVTTVFEVDLGAVLAHRAQCRADFEDRGAPLTLTAYFLAACVEALRTVPELNSRWRPEALEVYERIDIGVATALDSGGLVVPVVRDVASLDLFGIARGLSDVVTRARAERLVPADVRGGTFTISNHGVSGSLLAAPIIIHQPQSAILGIGKVEKRPVVTMDDGREAVSIRPRCYVSLTIDHRVLDGQRANQFLGALTRCLEHWPL
jgi:2-oxoglutarate dehydrogenase E2 component (dihydrolipoamide succinyltransferase)